MLLAIANGRAWLSELQSGNAETIEGLARRHGRTPRSIQMTISLAFLAPQIVQAIVDSTLPRGVGVSQLCDLPPDWQQQKETLGISVAGPVARTAGHAA